MQYGDQGEFNKTQPNSLQDKASRDPDLARRIALGRMRAERDDRAMENWFEDGQQSWNKGRRLKEANI